MRPEPAGLWRWRRGDEAQEAQDLGDWEGKDNAWSVAL